MEKTAPLPKRTYRDISRNRRRLLRLAYETYPQYVYCDPEEFTWYEPAGRVNIFDLYYLADSGYVEVTQDASGGHRRPDFYILTPRGADLLEAPGSLAARLPLRGRGRKKERVPCL